MLIVLEIRIAQHLRAFLKFLSIDLHIWWEMMGEIKEIIDVSEFIRENVKVEMIWQIQSLLELYASLRTF